VDRRLRWPDVGLRVPLGGMLVGMDTPDEDEEMTPDEFKLYAYMKIRDALWGMDGRKWRRIPVKEGESGNYFRSGVLGLLRISEDTLNVLMLLNVFPEPRGIVDDGKGPREWWGEEELLAFGYRLGMTKEEMLGEWLELDEG
jgi:hypothetical protein